MPSETPRLRLGILGVVAIALFGALFVRLWFLQVVSGPSFQVAAEQNQVRLVAEQAPRGRILDRNGDVLVDNRQQSMITVVRTLNAADQQLVTARLAALLGTDVDQLRARLDDRRISPYKPVPVAVDVPEAAIIAIREQPELFPGVEATTVAVRGYPHGSLLAHVLGYVGEINDDELLAHEGEGYGLGDEIGKSGVELVFEQELRGVDGLDKLEVDSQGRVLRTLGRRTPKQGSDLRLTIDLDIQQAAETALLDGLKATRQRRSRDSGRSFPAPAGSVVVLDPRDGSVLAMASYPTYDPSEFVGGIAFDTFDALQDPANHFPLNNRAIQGQYAPGSTFKMMTALAGLRTGVVTPTTTIQDRGALRVGNRTFRNAGGRSYGAVQMPRSLTVSSDVYYYTVGRDVWLSDHPRGIQDVAEEFGLGAKTGVALPFEASGRVPDEEGRRKLHEENPTAFPEGRWFTGDNVNLAIGQGELVVTPLQLANAYATFANGGTRWVPRVADAVVDQDGTVLDTFEADEAATVELPPEQRDPILAGLVGAVGQQGGTAYWVFRDFPLDQFRLGGKTGTAQVVGKEDTAVFVGFGPVESPRYVVVAMLEQSGFGSTGAAPVVRQVFDGIARLEGVGVEGGPPVTVPAGVVE